MRIYLGIIDNLEDDGFIGLGLSAGWAIKNKDFQITMVLFNYVIKLGAQFGGSE